MKSVLKKIRRYGGRNYYGVFSPVEILKLIKNGAKDSSYNSAISKIANKLKNSGKGGTLYFYFTMNKELEEKAIECNKHLRGLKH